jgi:hypothetical protein
MYSKMETKRGLNGSWMNSTEDYSYTFRDKTLKVPKAKVVPEVVEKQMLRQATNPGVKYLLRIEKTTHVIN